MASHAAAREKRIAVIKVAAEAGMDIQTDNYGQIVIYTDLMYNEDTKTVRQKPIVQFVESGEDEDEEEDD